MKCDGYPNVNSALASRMIVIGSKLQEFIIIRVYYFWVMATMLVASNSTIKTNQIPHINTQRMS